MAPKTSESGCERMLSKTIAAKIVYEIHKIIDYDINIMDENAFIQASTNPERVGTFHAGAKKVIMQQLDELLVYSEDEYFGAREGINLPIVFNGHIAGVVGITGRHEDVKSYGQIIKKMTEILLLDISYKEQAAMNEQMRKSLLEEYIFGNAAINQFQIDRGRSLGIDITLPRRLLLLDVQPQQAGQAPGDAWIWNVVRKVVARLPNTVVSNIHNRVLLLVSLKTDAELAALVEQIHNALRAHGDVLLRAGIDLQPQSFGGLNISFTQAMKALTAAENNGTTVNFYSGTYLEIFLDEIPDSLRQDYLNNVFCDSKPEELAEWMGILKVFYKHNGSIGKTSEELFIHKNTLQYKLRRIMISTGLDPRDIGNAAIFQMAMRFYRRPAGA